MLIKCPTCDSTIPINLTVSPVDNPLMVCPACNQLFSLSQIKNNPIDQRIQAVQKELMMDSEVKKSSMWCEEC